MMTTILLPNQIGTVYQGHCDPRFVTGEAVRTYREACALQLATVTKTRLCTCSAQFHTSSDAANGPVCISGRLCYFGLRMDVLVTWNVSQTNALEGVVR